MIADEVATGFGRTGRMFACEFDRVTPDLMAISKGLTGGYLPLAATLATEKVFAAFLGAYPEWKTFFHGHSYSGNALGCAVALANLETFRRDRTLLRLRPKIRALARLLRSFGELANVGEVRQRGFMVGIELVRDRATKEPYPLARRMGHRVAQFARRHGLLIRPLGNVVVLMPPLTTRLADLTKIVAIIRRAIRAVTEGTDDTGGLPQVRSGRN
jgi:adenosylmethionine-8-amino-7-oxononanoate aminotransferase